MFSLLFILDCKIMVWILGSYLIDFGLKLRQKFKLLGLCLVNCELVAENGSNLLPSFAV